MTGHLPLHPVGSAHDERGSDGAHDEQQQSTGGTSGPDGIAVDNAGGLAIANPGHGCVWLVDATGVPRHRIASGAGRTITNLAHDPLDLARVVFTCSDTGQVLEARVPVAGHLLASHR